MWTRAVLNSFVKVSLSNHASCFVFQLLFYDLEGAPLYGLLQQAGIGEARDVEEPGDPVACLKGRCKVSNRQLLASLREGEHAQGLMELACLDASLGRMSDPIPAEQCCLDDVLLAPRFAVVQGVQADGSVKIRAVDHFSWSCTPDGAPTRRSKREMKGAFYSRILPPPCSPACSTCTMQGIALTVSRPCLRRSAMIT